MCITGEAGGFWDHFGAKKKKEKKTGSNVATCQCRDVWLTEEKVNERATSTHKLQVPSFFFTNNTGAPQESKNRISPNDKVRKVYKTLDESHSNVQPQGI